MHQPALTPAEEATAPSSIRRAAGFDIELLRSAKADEDSWVSMSFDDRGRIILGLDRVGVGRLTLAEDGEATFEKLENTLKHCRGVLWAYDSIYVDSTNSKQIVRLFDRDGDGTFESQTTLLQLDYRSRFGHGSNQMRLGPDGMIYVVVGNDVSFPENTLTTSPYRHPQNDWLLPEPNDLGHDDRVGYILRMDKDGHQRTILAGGFRNQVDMAFDAKVRCLRSTPIWSGTSALLGIVRFASITSSPAASTAGVGEPASGQPTIPTACRAIWMSGWIANRSGVWYAQPIPRQVPHRAVLS